MTTVVQERTVSPADEVILTYDYKFLETLSEGHFLKVKLAFHLRTATQVVVNIFKNNNSSDVKAEVNIIKSLEHPNIMRLFHFLETPTNTYVIMESVSGVNLERYLKRLGCFSEKDVQHIFRQVVLAVKYCHRNNIVHGDITPRNILIDVRGIVKLCNFSMASKVMAGKRLRNGNRKLPYFIPEVLQSRDCYAFAADVWSLGILLYTIATGNIPYDSEAQSELPGSICNTDCAIPTFLSENIINIIEHLLCSELKHRLTFMVHILKHPWFSHSGEVKLSPPPETLPNIPVPRIVRAMVKLGYKLPEILECVRNEIFNEVLVTYRILKNNTVRTDLHELKEKPLMSSFSTSSVLPLRRTLSDPALPKGFSMCRKHQLHDDMNILRKGAIKQGMPPMQCYPQTMTSSYRQGPQHATMSKDIGSYSAKPRFKMPSGAMIPENSLFLGAQKAETSTVTDSMNFRSPSPQETHPGADSTSNQPLASTVTTQKGSKRGWRGILSALRQLNSCLKFQK